MSKHARDRRPYVKPVKRIELSEKNIKLRWILIIVLLSIAVVSIMIGLFSALNTEPGWQEVEANSQDANCAGDFVLMYDFSDAGSAATDQNKQLIALYTEATETAYRIFTPDLLEEGLYNVAYLNAHVNEAVTVDETLYQALELTAKYGDRHVFTAPAMAEYSRVFLCENEAEAAIYDPTQNPETTAWLKELGSFINDPEKISLEILGNGQVRLNASDDYLSFVEEHEIEKLFDFGWMTNAFIVDYLAEVLTENGFTCGYLASYDGFTRNLDSRGNMYSFNLFDRQGSNIELPAQMQYDQPISIVFLRDYPMTEEDKWHYFAFTSGEILTAMLDPADCMSKSAVHNLVSYSYESGCGEILLQTASLFTADSFDTAALDALVQRDIYSFWVENKTMRYNDPAIMLTANMESNQDAHSSTNSAK